MVYANTAYGYDGAGNLTSIGDSIDSTLNRTLGYDGINRLTSATGPWGSGIISYSGAGNITSQSFGGVALNYIYDGANRLASVSGSRSSSFGYDAYGNVTSAGTATYAYDGAPNLRCVNCSNPSTKIEYGYDGLNQRVVTTKAGAKSYEIYASNGNLLAEYTPSQQNLLVEYIYLGGKRIAQKRTSDGVATTSTALTAAPNPAVVNQAVTLTATVSGSNPTGLVVFKDGSTTLASVSLSGGRAVYMASFPVVGTRSLTASYGGDSANGTSTATAVSLSVIPKASSSTLLTVLPNPAVVGESVALRASVTGISPTGQVNFSDGATPLGSAPLSLGVATLNSSFATTGSRSISATYVGDAYNNSSVSAPVVLSVLSKFPTTTAINPLPDWINNRHCVIISAVVSGNSPTGTAKLIAPNKKLQPVVAISAQGIAQFPSNRYSAGTYQITVEYSGDARNAPVSAPEPCQFSSRLWLASIRLAPTPVRRLSRARRP